MVTDPGSGSRDSPRILVQSCCCHRVALRRLFLFTAISLLRPSLLLSSSFGFTVSVRFDALNFGSFFTEDSGSVWAVGSLPRAKGRWLRGGTMVAEVARETRQWLLTVTVTVGFGLGIGFRFGVKVGLRIDSGWLRALVSFSYGSALNPQFLASVVIS